MDRATKDAFAKLTETVEGGFAAVAEDIAAARDDLRSEFKRDIAGLRQVRFRCDARCKQG